MPMPPMPMKCACWEVVNIEREIQLYHWCAAIRFLSEWPP